jgi:hypothetical protein
MIARSDVAVVRAEIQRLQKARDECTDSGVQKRIDVWIEEQKRKLVGEEFNVAEPAILVRLENESNPTEARSSVANADPTMDGAKSTLNRRIHPTRCPYCLEGDGFKVMIGQGGGPEAWYMCARCGHLSVPSNLLFQCTCIKCRALAESLRRRRV